LREWLAAHPEAQESLDLETGLTEALRKVPDVPVASNFTARVLQAVEREAIAGGACPGLALEGMAEAAALVAQGCVRHSRRRGRSSRLSAQVTTSKRISKPSSRSE